MSMTIQYKTVFVFIFLTSLLFNSHLKSQQLALPKQILAEIGNHKINLNDFKIRYEEYLFSSGLKDNIVTRRAILNNAINEIILEKFDDNSNIFSNPEFKREIEWARKQTLLAYLKDQLVYAKITASDAEVRDAFYKSNVKIAARHLYCQTEEEADAVYQLLQTGSKFDELAKQLFTDSTLQNNGGYLGYFSWGEMDPAFEDAAYALQVNEISKPVKLKNGFSIIKVEDRVPLPIMTENEFLNKKNHMQRVVKMRKRRPAEVDFMNKVFNQNEVKINDDGLNKLLNQLTDDNKELEKSSKNKNPIVASYKGRTFRLNYLLTKITDFPKYHLEKINSVTSLKNAVKGLILQEILLEIANKNNFEKASEVKSVTAKYEKNIFLRYKRTEIADKSVFPDSVLNSFYEDNIVKFMESDKINVQEIIVKENLLADRLVSELREGTDFGKLAKEHSTREWSKSNSGILGLADVSKFGILKDTLWNAELGKIVGPVKIDNVYGIFKVLEKKKGLPKKFNEVYDEVVHYTKKEKSRIVVEQYISSISKKIKIFIDEDLLGHFTLSQ
jgi:parvulin-like peptidyl-prolyl isomerase